MLSLQKLKFVVGFKFQFVQFSNSGHSYHDWHGTLKILIKELHMRGIKCWYAHIH